MNKILNWMTPKYIKKRIAKSILNWVKEKRRIESIKIPRYLINELTIHNTKLLLDRQKLLEYLPKDGVIAELGVDKGDFSELILKTSRPKKLHLVDIWATEEYNQEKRKLVEDKFKEGIESGVVEINLGLSVDVGLGFMDNYFDWIYIDTNHSYQNTINELEIWKSKIKEGGIIAGHDFIVGYWDGMIRYGVMEAVYEFCSKYNWEILYLTMEIGVHPSFAIRKIS
jgi:hypothetical protein